MRRFPSSPALALGLAAALSACDATPGSLAVEDRIPVVSGLRYTPGEVDVNAPGSPYAVSNDTVTVPLVIEVAAVDPDGGGAAPVFVVESPYAGREPAASGRLQAVGAGAYRAELNLKLPAAEPGRYAVVVYATDDEGRVSNQVRGALDFRLTGTAPVVEAVQTDPERLRAPYPADLVLTATVTDADGAGNVAHAEARADDGAVTLLLDDGDTFRTGDEEAGDGRFSGRIPLDSGFTGPLRFTLRAVDRAGLESAPVEKEVAVE